MDLKTLKEESEIITNKIIKKYSDLDRGIEPVIDGIVSLDEYIDTNPKILWILKEPYDEMDGTGGGWQLVRDFPKDEEGNYFFKGGKSTWRPIVYICYAIFNQYADFNKMPNIDINPEMTKVLNKIAVINISKVPGSTRSNGKLIEKAFHKNKEILSKQIEIYNPDIIIGGNTLGYFFDKLNQFTDSGSVYYYKKENRLWINAYHPAHTQFNRETYVNEIISAVKDKF